MPNKKINQLATRILSATDLLLIGDPISGISYKGLVSDLSLVYVPYTGATTDVNLGEHQLLAGQMKFDLSPTGATGVGVLRWNNVDGTLDLGLIGGNVTLQIGQEEVQRVVNKSGILLTEAAYQVVKVTSAQGQRLAVDLAQGNNDANSTDTLGIVTENISNNQEGYITTSGLVRNIDTRGVLQGETWIDGDVLYLSPFTAGAITNIKPTAPNHTVILGYVVHAHPTQGKIFVKCDNGYEIGELHNVYAPTPSNNDGIFWNTTNQRYENNSIIGALGYTPQSALTLTTTGTSGAATLVGATLNIPQYSASMAIGGSITSATAGSVLFAGTSGVLQQDNANLFWDDTNNRLGIGTTTPVNDINISANTNINRGIRISNSNTGTASTSQIDLISSSYQFSTLVTSSNYTPYGVLRPTTAALYTNGNMAFAIDSASAYFAWGTGQPPTDKMRLTAAGRLLLGTTTESTYLLDVNGTARVSGDLAITSIIGNSIASSATSYFFNVLNISGVVLAQFNNNGTTAKILDGNVQFTTGSIINSVSHAAVSIGVTHIYGSTGGANGGQYFGAVDNAGNSTRYMVGHGAKGLKVELTPNNTWETSALLQVNSTTKGFLQPRMTTTERNAIATPATGLQVYNTTTNTNDVYNGTAWVAMALGNIYTADGTLSGNRTVTMGSNTLSFSGTGNIGIGMVPSIANKLDVAGTINSSTDSFFNGIRIGHGQSNQAFNFIVGSSGFNVNTTGNFNTAVGISALEKNTTGSVNCAVGGGSLANNTSGYYNLAVGVSTLLNLSSGSYNTALGVIAGEKISGGVTNLTTANNSIFIGYGTRALADSQTNQIVIGYQSTGLGSNTTVIGNSSTTDTAIYGRMLVNYSAPVLGTYALDVNGTARVSGDMIINTLKIGLGNSQSSANIVIGNGAGNAWTLGTRNIGIGYFAQSAQTTGDSNIAIGYEALKLNTAVDHSIAIGYGAMSTTLSGGTGSIAIGTSALSKSTAQNIGIGLNAGSNITSGSSNILLGNAGAALTTGTQNVAIGYSALSVATTQQGNTAIGHNSGRSGSQNTSIGVDSLRVVTGNGNVGVGIYAGYSSSSGSNNLFLGNSAGTYATTQSNQIFIGTLDRGTYDGDLNKTPFYISQSTTLTSQVLALNGVTRFSASSTGTPLVNTSALVEIISTTQGFLPPRMTNAQRIAIGTPAVGLMVYCTDATEGLYIYKSTGWTFVI